MIDNTTQKYKIWRLQLLLDILGTRKKNNEKLELIAQIQEYKHGQEPLLSREKKIAIQQKLKLEKEAVYNAKRRQSDMEYYIKFNYNPFMECQGKESQVMKQYVRNNKKQVSNIVDKITQMKMVGPQVKPKIAQKSLQFNEQKISFQMFSDKILNKIQKQTSQVNNNQAIKQILLKRAASIQQPKSKIAIKPSKKLQQVEIRLKEDENLQNRQIQGIIALKEENHFIKNHKKVNIFKVVKGQDDEISSRQLLKKMHFCENSIVEKIQRIKIPIYKDISALARRIISFLPVGSENIIDYVDSYELSFKLKQLIFHDVLSVASNRFSSEFLNKMLNYDDNVANKQTSDASSEEQQQVAVIYKKRQINRQNNFINQNEEMQQIKDYKNLSYNDPELKYDERCQQMKEKILKKMELRKDLVRRTVKDQQIHNNIGMQVRQQLAGFLKIPTQRLEQTIEADRLIRQNKLFKNKKDVVRLKALIETMATKNKQEDLLKSKSPTSIKKRIIDLSISLFILKKEFQLSFIVEKQFLQDKLYLLKFIITIFYIS